MTWTNEQNRVGIIAVLSDREWVERALRRLATTDSTCTTSRSSAGASRQPSFPAGVVTTGEIAAASAELGAVAGFLCGLVIGAAIVVVPGVGPLLVAGSLSAALAVGAAEGAVVGGFIGGLGGALVAWGIPSVHVQKYETHLSEGWFLVLVRTDSESVEYVRSVLAPGAMDEPEAYEIGVSNTQPRQSEQCTEREQGNDANLDSTLNYVNLYALFQPCADNTRRADRATIGRRVGPPALRLPRTSPV